MCVRVCVQIKYCGLVALKVLGVHKDLWLELPEQSSVKDKVIVVLQRWQLWGFLQPRQHRAALHGQSRPARWQWRARSA